MQKLKACPFCGNEKPHLFHKGDGWMSQYVVTCDFSSGGCGASTGLYFSEEDAVRAWNRRAK